MEMSLKCPQCGHENLPDSVWCDNCGSKLQAPPPPQVSPPPPPPPPPPPVTYSLSFGGGVLEISDVTRTFGRQDFARNLPEEEYKYISRNHFTIAREDDRFYVQDDGSMNGTKLNGVEIKGAGKKELKDNDKILVADVVELGFAVKK